jgi:O-antigen ligase
MDFWRAHIPHYYGDLVRALFVGTAVALIVGDAFFNGAMLPMSIGAQLGVVIVFILLAALTNPHGPAVMFVNAFAAAVGAFIFESFAIPRQASESAVLFLLQELAALFLIFAFYYSIKTLRAFGAGLLGRYTPQGEFDEREK